MYTEDIGIKIVSYKSIAPVVKILRKYTGRSISEIKSAVDKGKFIFSGDQCDDDDLKNLIECYKDLTGSLVKAKLYQNGREISLQFLLNLRESYCEINYELEAEKELENADMEALEEFKYLWMEEQDEWGIIKKEYDYVIYNKEKHEVLLIENEDLNNQVAAMMIMNGCKVVSGVFEWQNKYSELGSKLLEELYVKNSEENVVCSPFLLYMLLGIALNAVKGDTREEINRVLSSQASNDVFKKLQYDFTRTRDGCRLVSSNAVCVENNLYNSILDEYRMLVRDVFAAEIFDSGSDVANRINEWANEKTGGLIPEIIDRVPDDLKFIFLNAAVFDARWDKKYEEDDIEEESVFENADGTESLVTMLSSTEGEYIKNRYVTGFIKNYKGERFAFMGLLPRQEGSEYMRKSVNWIDFKACYESRISKRVDVVMPEFAIDSTMELKEFCKKIGICRIFEDDADSGGILANEQIKSDSILQKAVIRVDSNGTKAGAVTEAVCVVGCVPDFNETARVCLDRPFIYAIIDREYGLPVFCGVVNHL